MARMINLDKETKAMKEIVIGFNNNIMIPECHGNLMIFGNFNGICGDVVWNGVGTGEINPPETSKGDWDVWSENLINIVNTINGGNKIFIVSSRETIKYFHEMFYALMDMFMGDKSTAEKRKILNHQIRIIDTTEIYERTFVKLDKHASKHRKEIAGKKIDEIVYDNVFDKIKDMKFDVIITNPPYNKDLHLQILDELTKIANKVVCVHPGRWVEDVLAKYKDKNATGRKYEHLKKMLTKVMMIKQKDGVKMFNIKLKQDMMIGVYESNHNNTDELPIYKEPKMFFSVLDNILKYAHNVANIGERTDTNPTGVSDRDKDDGIRCQVFDIKPMIDYVKDPKCSSAEYHVKVIGNEVIIDGKVNGEFWANANKKNTKTHGKEVGTPIPISIKVNNIDDAQTIVNLYQTPLMKNIINLIKYDQNVGHTHIPYFDPKVIKTEDDVLDALGITDENYRQWMKRDVYDYREKDFIKYNEWIDC